MMNNPILEFESFLNDEKKMRMVKDAKPRYIKLLPGEKPYGLNNLLGHMSENIYLSTDWHIGDPVDNWEERRNRLVETINAVVKPDDHLLFLGDLTAHTITANIIDVQNTIKMINCKNLYMILGNNDYESIETYVNMGFKTVTDKFIWKNIVFTHIPAKISLNQINIHGDLHEELIYINVDCQNHANVWDREMKPIRLRDVLERLKSGYYKGITINDEEDLDNHCKEKYFNEGTLESSNNYIRESVSSLDSSYKPKGKKNLSAFKRIHITETIIDKYKKEYPLLKHVRCKDTKEYVCDGYIWFDNNELVAMVGSCEYIDDKTKWVVSLEITRNYRGYGLSKQILDYAVKTMHCKYLSVNKNNEVAKKVYEDYGFKVYTESDSMYYMTIDKNINKSTVVKESSDDDLTKFSWYHLELDKEGFNPKKCSTGWDEELYYKSIDYAIRGVGYTIRNMEDSKTSGYLWTATSDENGIHPIYLGKITIYRTNNEKWFNWEWEEQEYLGDKEIHRIIKSQGEQTDTESYVQESCRNLNEARKLCTDVQKLAKKYNANFFFVTDGASAYSNGNNGYNNAVKEMRNHMDNWEKKNGFNPDDDWSNNMNDTSSYRLAESYIMETKRSNLPDCVFGIPEERKYPLDTKKHVYSAVKLFNHVSPQYEEKLAKNIIKKINEYGITDIEPGENNRFSKSYKPNNV